MSFSVVVVLHDSAAELRVLLASIEAHLPVSPQLIVVDSGSGDDGAAVARAAGADVVVLDGNPGFGAANNAGLARARHDVTVLLNPDGTLQRSAHPVPGTPMALLRAVLPTRALPEPHRAERPTEAGWAIAACVAARTSLLRDLGPFD